MTNIFVTGGTGFIGSHFVNSLDKKKHRVVLLVRDFLPSPWLNWLNQAIEGCILVKGDLLNQRLLHRIITQYNVQEVYHFAAQAIVSTAKKNPYGTYETNLMGTVALLETCRQTDVEKIYVQSTDKIYGERMNAKETHPLVSTGIYETSKACQDLIAQSYLNIYSLNILIGRPCNVYGYDLAKRIIPNTIRSCLKGESPVIFEGEETIRQYIYIQDLVDAIHYITAIKKKGIYNIASDTLLPQDQVVKRICNYFPLSPRLTKRQPPKEIKRQSLDWTKLRLLGWKPKYTFEKAIQETIKRFTEFGY